MLDIQTMQPFFKSLRIFFWALAKFLNWYKNTRICLETWFTSKTCRWQLNPLLCPKARWLQRGFMRRLFCNETMWISTFCTCSELITAIIAIAKAMCSARGTVCLSWVSYRWPLWRYVAVVIRHRETSTHRELTFVISMVGWVGWEIERPDI